MVARWALGLALLAACSPESLAPPELPPVLCVDGQRADATGQCTWILPTSDCAPHTHARVGMAECQPIGAGPCEPPFQPSSEWGCVVAPASCPGRTMATLFGECRPVGWASCPEGFFEEGGGCRPIFGKGCTGATRPAIGEPGCVAIGACGGPPRGDLYVDPAGPEDATHFRAIGPAVDAALVGAVISIAPGTYAESPLLTRSVSLRGACAEAVVVRGGVTVNAGAAVEISGLTLSGDRAGIRAQADAQVMVEDVVIDGSLGAGVRVEGARLQLSRSVIRDVRAFADGSFGRGVDVAEGGTVVIRNSAIIGPRQAGVSAGDLGSVAELEGVLVLDVTRAPRGAGGVGVVAAAGGRIRGDRVAIANVADIGALAYQSPSVVELGSVFIEHTGLLGAGAGVRVDSGGAMTLSQATLVDTIGAGILVADPASTATVSDVWIGRVKADPDTGFSAGLASFFSARLNAVRVFVQETSFGATASAEGELTISDVRLEVSSLGVLADAGRLRLVGSTLSGALGGAVAQNDGWLSVEGTVVLGSEVDGGLPTAGITTDGSTLTLSGSAILGGIGFGLLVTGTTAVARVTDTLVRDQRSTDRVIGQGILCDQGRLDLDRVRVDQVDGLGILAQGRVSIARTTVSGVTASRRQNGAAIAVGGVARFQDVAVIGNQLAGMVLGPGDLQIDGLLVSGTTFNDQNEFGHGLLGEGTTLSARGVELRGSATAGLAMDNSTARLSRSLIVGNVIGAQVQGGSRLVEASDVAPSPLDVVVASDVLLLDNQTRVGLGTIPLPKPFEALPR
ncbi:MAG: right-handed parallel beta-helix repeat-containing protein [Deltaproteobacteria bacterium]|nr:right-handed parallel beta-helix repeat-containing protein [Deltaproteobacteria bacterium]